MSKETYPVTSVGVLYENKEIDKWSEVNKGKHVSEWQPFPEGLSYIMYENGLIVWGSKRRPSPFSSECLDYFDPHPEIRSENQRLKKENARLKQALSSAVSAAKKCGIE